MIGNILCMRKGFLIWVLGIFHSFSQGSGIGFFFWYKILDGQKLFDELFNKYIICPLCKGAKLISESVFEKYERCQKCTKKCGYEDGIGFLDRRFCFHCDGVGYCLKEENPTLKIVYIK